MRNYMKSEWYRILHSKEIYLLTGIMSGLLLLMNIVLMISNKKITEFRYATVAFSLNTLLASMTTLLVCGAMTAGFLFAGDRKNGIMKNAVAYGVSREKIFTGKCIVSCLTGLGSMLVILLVYAGSACLLLDGPIDASIRELITGVGASLLCIFASAILSAALFQFFEKDITAIVVWFTVMFILPEVCFFAGLRFELLNRIAEWMPWSFLSMEVQTSMDVQTGMGVYDCLWNRPEGLAKCLIAGAVGIIVFYISGIVINRKKNL